MYQLRGKNLADSVAICGRGREIFRPATYNRLRPSVILRECLEFSCWMQYSMSITDAIHYITAGLKFGIWISWCWHWRAETCSWNERSYTKRVCCFALSVFYKGTFTPVLRKTNNRIPLWARLIHTTYSKSVSLTISVPSTRIPSEVVSSFQVYNQNVFKNFLPNKWDTFRLVSQSRCPHNVRYWVQIIDLLS